ncbi:MAG: 50S ribosomal protein L1 [Mycoplasma sp.]|nr:50S ribosomal protein L1 [Mycoplasma sp.]
MAKKINKKLAEARKKVDAEKFYTLSDAIKLAKETSYTKFVGSLDLAIKLNLDVRKAEQQLRGSIALPHSTGKTVKVLVVTNDANLTTQAKEAGADLVYNTEDLTAMLQKEVFDFDIMVADPKMMPVLGKYGRLLGPKGLMPNPKEGTVTPNVGKAVTELKKGKAKYRTDKSGIVHVSIGKASISDKELLENAEHILAVIKKLRPTVVKGAYFLTLSISASMGPSIKIEF